MPGASLSRFVSSRKPGRPGWDVRLSAKSGRSPIERLTPGAERRATLAEGATLTERDGYEHGVPCWVDTWQEDPDTAARFYAGVFGWDVNEVTPPGADTRYDMCRLGGSDVAAIGSPPRTGMPPARTT